MSEFRVMLAALDPDGSAQNWKGRILFWLSRRAWERERVFVSSPQQRNHIEFNEKERKAVRELFRRAWELPAVREIWDGLILKYGEL